MEMNEQDPASTSGGLSDEQEKVKIILRICSGSLSVLGSTTIILKILRDLSRNRSRSMTPYDRIMIGLSIFDILASFTWGVHTFLSPSDSSTGVWAIGNQTSCEIAGFLSHISLLAWWYNCILSFYFMLTILSQVRRKNFVRKSELWLHLSGIFFPIAAIMGLRRGWYGEKDLGTACWIVDPAIEWIVAGLPSFVTLFAVLINSIVIYALVRKSLRSSQHERLKREARTLMFLYVGFFFVTVAPTIAISVLDIHFGYSNDNAEKIYPLSILQSIFMPLQGFFNVFIFFKPTYARFRAAHPDRPIYFILHQSMFNSQVPQLRDHLPVSMETGEQDTTNPNEALFNSNYPLSNRKDATSLSDPPSSSIVPSFASKSFVAKDFPSFASHSQGDGAKKTAKPIAMEESGTSDVPSFASNSSIPTQETTISVTPTPASLTYQEDLRVSSIAKKSTEISGASFASYSSPDEDVKKETEISDIAPFQPYSYTEDLPSSSIPKKETTISDTTTCASLSHQEDLRVSSIAKTSTEISGESFASSSSQDEQVKKEKEISDITPFEPHSYTEDLPSSSVTKEDTEIPDDED